MCRIPEMRLRNPNNRTRLANEPAQSGAELSPGGSGREFLNELVVATSVVIVSTAVTGVFDPFAESDVGLKLQVEYVGSPEQVRFIVPL